VFKNFATKDWLIFLEKYGQPTRIGKYPAGTQPSEVDLLKLAVQNLGVDAAAVISDSMVIELIEAKSSGASSDIYDKFITERVNKAYEKCILGQTATTEGTPGKLGGEEAQSQVRLDLLTADATDVSEALIDQLIWPMVGFNFGFEKMLPQFRLIVEEPEDRLVLAQTHKILVEIGVPIPISFAQKKYNIPDVVGDEPVLSVAAPAPVVPQVTPPVIASLKKKLIVPVGSRRLAFPDSRETSRTRLNA
jgi:phage gp29-like protein